jgi:hypothetical protein
MSALTAAFCLQAMAIIEKQIPDLIAGAQEQCSQERSYMVPHLPLPLWSGRL